ncbi:formylglycine-generating enzyme family protein [Tamlana flava]|uniref:formylglycine-generating enzyme family protein n=1 Tax=Tamlana flava TaxID=3158572 RepID=UPI00351B6CAC
MTKQEALEKLELETGASQQDIKQQYQEFYNEFQLRITNAPTTHQKTLYQNKLKQLEEAYSVLTGKSIESMDSEIPWSSPGETLLKQNIEHAITKAEPETPNEKQPESSKEKITKTRALSLLELKEPFTKLMLTKAFKAKKKVYEKSKTKHTDKQFIQALDEILNKQQQAYELLLPLALADEVKLTENKGRNSSIIWVLLILVIVTITIWILKPWADKIDPKIEKQFTTLKAQADLLVKRNELNEALEGYKKAYALIPNQEVNDSIASIKRQLDAITKKEETDWEIAKSTNTIDSYQNYLETYPNGKFLNEASNAISSIKKMAIEMRQKEENDKLKKALVEINNIPDNLPKEIKKIVKDMVYVKGGSFIMGCTSEQKDCEDDEYPPHQVTLSNFFIGKYEITRVQWNSLMGYMPDNESLSCEQCPITSLSWYNVQDFIVKLNDLTGNDFRLPTEAEWEYAARGGMKSKNYIYSGSNTISVVGSESSNKPVGSYKANELGLYDMTGKTAEWCQDWYDEDYYDNSPTINPTGPNTGERRVLRGSGARKIWMRNSNRGMMNPDYGGFITGFRLVINTPH